MAEFEVWVVTMGALFNLNDVSTDVKFSTPVRTIKVALCP